MIDVKKHLPDNRAWIRAAVSVIPNVGGALDHLLFDKADLIRTRNMEAAIASLSAEIEKQGAEKLNRDWFASDEALAAFKLLAEKASYEPDMAKIDALGRLVAVCGTAEHAADPKKLSVLDHLSRLTCVQIKILAAILGTPIKEKTFSSNSFRQTGSAIWITDIAATLKAGPQFWSGQLELNEELDILGSHNTIRQFQLMNADEVGFALTSIGIQAATYAKSAKL